MKIVGMIVLTVGLALLIFVIYSFFKDGDKLLSPIPEEKGVKVIFITPTP